MMRIHLQAVALLVVCTKLNGVQMGLDSGLPATRHSERSNSNQQQGHKGAFLQAASRVPNHDVKSFQGVPWVLDYSDSWEHKLWQRFGKVDKQYVQENFEIIDKYGRSIFAYTSQPTRDVFPFTIVQKVHRKSEDGSTLKDDVAGKSDKTSTLKEDVARKSEKTSTLKDDVAKFVSALRNRQMQGTADLAEGATKKEEAANIPYLGPFISGAQEPQHELGPGKKGSMQSSTNGILELALRNKKGPDYVVRPQGPNTEVYQNIEQNAIRYTDSLNQENMSPKYSVDQTIMLPPSVSGEGFPNGVNWVKNEEVKAKK